MQNLEKTTTKTTVSLVTQNCFFSKLNRKIINLVNETRADVYCFQEIRDHKTADRIKKRTGYKYAMSNPIKAIFGKTLHNAIFTNLPIVDTGDLNYRKTPGKSNKKAFWAVFDSNDTFAGKVFWAILEKNGVNIKVYNSYLSMNGVGMEERQSILESILNDAKKFEGPTVVCGDMNTASLEKGRFKNMVIKTWCRSPEPSQRFTSRFQGMSEKFVFFETAQKHGFKELADLKDSTFVFPIKNPVLKNPLFDFKLDWFMVKGFEYAESVIGSYIGDHRSIIGNLSFAEIQN